jgi:hypothetical protein
MDLHPDFKELLAECVAARVEFAVVGGYAVGFHARPRATKDLDLAATTAEADEVIYFGVAPLRVDIMTQADGIDTRAALERAVYADLGTVSVPILGLTDLIANKRASGRKQDLADLEALELFRSGP